MNDLLAFYLIIGLLLATLSLFTGTTRETLAKRSLPWISLWIVLITTLWLPVLAISVIIVVVGTKLDKESEE